MIIAKRKIVAMKKMLNEKKLNLKKIISWKHFTYKYRHDRVQGSLTLAL